MRNAQTPPDGKWLASRGPSSLRLLASQLEPLRDALRKEAEKSAQQAETLIKQQVKSRGQ